MSFVSSAGLKSMERPPAELSAADEDPPPSPPVPEAMEAMWGMEASGAECDCPGPPPEFLLPPPPRPPILQPDNPLYCTEDPLPIETCDALPVSQKNLIFVYIFFIKVTVFVFHKML